MASRQGPDDSLPSVDADPVPPKEEVTNDQSTPHEVTDDQSSPREVTDDQSTPREATGDQRTPSDVNGVQSTSEHVPSSHATCNVDSGTATQGEGTNYVVTGTAASAQSMSLPQSSPSSTEALLTAPSESTIPASGSSFQGGPSVSETAVPVNIAEIRSPHSDWRFNIFLSSLADAMTADDFRKIKFIFKGGVGKKALEKVDDPRDLFTLLATRGFLSKDNLLYLQKALFELGRKDLIKDVVEYARDVPNTLVCYPASNEPVNGYRHVKWHLEGKNFQNCTQSDIKAIRVHIAEVLCILPELVLIVGVEPSSSLLLTLMIPDVHVEILLDMLRKKENFPAFSQLGIDCIEINGEVFALTGPQTQKQSEQQKQLLNVYQQLHDLEKHMQCAELRCLTMEKNARALKLDLKEAEAVIASLKPKAADEGLEQEYNIRLETFKSHLEKLKQDKINPDLVFELLQSNNDLVWIINVWSGIEMQRGLQADLQVAQKALQADRYKFELLKSMLSSMPSETRSTRPPQEFANAWTQQQPGVALPLLQVVQSLTEPVVQLLRRISTKLAKGDIDKLKKQHNLNKDELWKKELDSDPIRILEAVFIKTANSSQVPLHFETVVQNELLMLGKQDLADEFCQEMNRMHEEFVKAARESERPKTKDADIEMMPTLKRMSEQIDFIYHKMETVSRLSTPDAFSNPCLDPLKFQPPPPPRFNSTEESKQ